MSNYNPLDIEAQEQARFDAELKTRLAEETEEKDIQWLMQSKRGRRIVWRLLSQSGVFQPVFHPTAMVMAFQEGKRNYGLQVLATVNKHCPELYPTMMKESTNDGNNVDRASRNDH